MNLITAVPIYRNKFQRPAFFFSSQDFSVGSIILVPFLKREKPALIVRIDDIETKKFFIRDNKIEINKITNKFKFKLLEEKIIDAIKKETKNNQLDIGKSLEKIFSKKAINQMNNINSLKSDFEGVKRAGDNLSIDFIKNKLKKGSIKSTGKTQRGIQSIDAIISRGIKTKGNLHTEKHYLVDEIRNYFGENAKKGKGSFGFYLGFFRRIPERVIYQYWSEVKQSNKSIKDQQKIFWWKIGKYLKKDA